MNVSFRGLHRSGPASLPTFESVEAVLQASAKRYVAMQNVDRKPLVEAASQSFDA
jgi:hypothetical protein